MVKQNFFSFLCFAVVCSLQATGLYLSPGMVFRNVDYNFIFERVDNLALASVADLQTAASFENFFADKGFKASVKDMSPILELGYGVSIYDGQWLLKPFIATELRKHKLHYAFVNEQDGRVYEQGEDIFRQHYVGMRLSQALSAKSRLEYGVALSSGDGLKSPVLNLGYVYATTYADIMPTLIYYRGSKKNPNIWTGLVFREEVKKWGVSMRSVFHLWRPR